jgi:uncharacterized membrane protein
MNALNKLVLEQMKNESKYLVYSFTAACIFTKIIFYNEEILTIIRLIASWYHLFLLPGFAWLYYWNELSFINRFIISFGVSLAVVGISSYYFGLLGFGLRIYAYLIPAIIVLLGYIFNGTRKE